MEHYVYIIRSKMDQVIFQVDKKNYA